MKGTIILLMCVCALFAHALPIAWINEIHYDNIGSDVNEFVEVVVLDPEKYYLDDMALYLVNGLNGQCYSLDTVMEFELGERIGAYQFFVWYKRGLQNDTEGMHLVWKDTTLDILAYEGTFIGTTEPSVGLSFPDINVCENSNSPDSCSIFRTGNGDSEWVYGSSTPGNCNHGQYLIERSSDIQLLEFKAKHVSNKTILIWKVENEDKITGYSIYSNDHLLGNIKKKELATNRVYTLNDESKIKLQRTKYTLSCHLFNGDETFLDTLICSSPLLRELGLGIPFPNPFNPTIKLPYALENPGEVSISIISLSGQCVYYFNKEDHPAGEYEHNIDLSHVASGEYFVEFLHKGMKQVKKISLIK